MATAEKSYSRLKPGTWLGRYLIERRIASGGMAEVWLGKAVGMAGFAREVCIKTISPPYCQRSEFIDMFIREAVLAARLHHPNIIQIFDFCESEYGFYIAMEYVYGNTVREIIRAAVQAKKKLPEWFAVYVSIAACDALNYAHEMQDDCGKPVQIIHRDVSPENIIVSKSGDVKLLDFGIAHISNDIHEDKPRVVKGKYRYMSPLLISGEEQLGVQTDIYSLGSVMYEMLTAQYPYDAPNEASLLMTIMEGSTSPDLSQKAPWLSAKLISIVTKAMARKPINRYHSAASLQADLETFAAKQGFNFSRKQAALYLASLFVHDNQASEREQNELEKNELLSNVSDVDSVITTVEENTQPIQEIAGSAESIDTSQDFDEEQQAEQVYSEIDPSIVNATRLLQMLREGPEPIKKETARFTADSFSPPSPKPFAKGYSPGMVLVPDCVFKSRFTKEKIRLQAFYVDQHLVTNAEYHRFIQNKGYDAPEHWLGRQYPATSGRHPVVGISYQAAFDYAQWANKRLLGPWEWERLATKAGTADFPWGDDYDTARFNGPEAQLGQSSEVGEFSLGTSAEGCADLIGNVWEWSNREGPGLKPEKEEDAWVFGGSFRHPVKKGRLARTEVQMTNSYLYLGFRCARNAR